MGTNLTDLRLPRRVTVRELGGCMGPIWHSYYSECSALLVSSTGNPSRGHGPGLGPVGPLGLAPQWDFPPCAMPAHPHLAFCSSLQFVVDASNPTQVSSSCIQLLSVLSAAPLASVPVLVLFNKM